MPENEPDYLVARLKVTDADERGTAAWRATYLILKGNEGGNFAVSTDPESNDGLLRTTKVSRGPSRQVAAARPLCSGGADVIKQVPHGTPPRPPPGHSAYWAALAQSRGGWQSKCSWRLLSRLLASGLPLGPSPGLLACLTRRVVRVQRPAKSAQPRFPDQH